VNQRIVILGGGPAGYEAALVAAELGADVTVVADEGLGGNSVLWDCVPSKALITTADTMGWLRTAESMGVHLEGVESIDRTVVDFPQVAANVLGLGVSQSNDIERRVRGAGVTLVRGRGHISAAHEVTVALEGGGERTLPADVLLVATGSAARVLPFFEPDGERVLVGHQVYGLSEVPEHLVVVGSGATGAEFANAFRRFGAEVTLVSSRDLILPTEDPDAAEVIEAVFERRGMTILRNARAVSCERRGDEVVIGLKDGREAVGSHAMFTVGQVPTSQDIGLEVCGVEINAWGGIDVDTVGWSPAEAESAGFPVETARLDFRSNPRAKMIHGLDGFVKVHAMVGSGTVLGGVVVSTRASDLIQPLAVAVQNRLSVAQLAQTMTVYPSMAGSVTECARMLMTRLDPQRR
jgi:dihydrolipoamide dehydrogenase